MPETPHADPPRADVGYETTDIQIGPMVLTAAILVFSLVLIHVGVVSLFDFLQVEQKDMQPQLSPLAAKERPKMPRDIETVPPIPSPRLEVSDKQNLKQLRKVEDDRLGKHGWVDPKRGTVHIPIEEAMKLLEDPKTAEAHGIRVQPANKAPGGGPQ